MTADTSIAVVNGYPTTVFVNGGVIFAFLSTRPCGEPLSVHQFYIWQTLAVSVSTTSP